MNKTEIILSYNHIGWKTSKKVGRSRAKRSLETNFVDCGSLRGFDESALPTINHVAILDGGETLNLFGPDKMAVYEHKTQKTTIKDHPYGNILNFQKYGDIDIVFSGGSPVVFYKNGEKIYETQHAFKGLYYEGSRLF